VGLLAEGKVMDASIVLLKLAGIIAGFFAVMAAAIVLPACLIAALDEYSQRRFNISILHGAVFFGAGLITISAGLALYVAWPALTSLGPPSLAVSIWLSLSAAAALGLFVTCIYLTNWWFGLLAAALLLVLGPAVSAVSAVLIAGLSGGGRGPGVIIVDRGRYPRRFRDDRLGPAGWG
jgi:hypothetical protein